MDEVKERIDDSAPEIITELFLAPYRYFSPMFWENGFKNMLDVGCGNGMGTSIMQKYFPKVVGVDKEILEFKPHFMQGDVTNLVNFADNSVDGAFCFEVIEHLNEEDQKKLLMELYRVSTKGFVIGSVNKEGPNTIKGVEIFKGEKNKYHIKELTMNDFVAIGDSYEKKFAQYYGSKYDKSSEVVRLDVLMDPYPIKQYCNYVKIIKE
jgi:ubiquinone/menaquinone biosynthesis C-methylase UbiE